jgi:hypothetical protein
MLDRRPLFFKPLLLLLLLLPLFDSYSGDPSGEKSRHFFRFPEKKNGELFGTFFLFFSGKLCQKLIIKNLKNKKKKP